VAFVLSKALLSLPVDQEKTLRPAMTTAIGMIVSFHCSVTLSKHTLHKIILAGFNATSFSTGLLLFENLDSQGDLVKLGEFDEPRPSNFLGNPKLLCRLRNISLLMTTFSAVSLIMLYPMEQFIKISRVELYLTVPEFFRWFIIFWLVYLPNIKIYDRSVKNVGLFK
jgi:hypothetical protein